jgi:predicted N-acetyltransferase YhbS
VALIVYRERGGVRDMNRIIKNMENKYLETSAQFVEDVFTDSEGKESASIVKQLVLEIRSKRFYLPELELIMVDELDCILGYAMFSRFHLEGKYENELLLLSPVAVKTELQRQHISKDIIEYGFEKAAQMGYQAVLVEGNPQNYRSRGFQTSADFGIMAGKNMSLPSKECLMVKELVKGALHHINGVVDYSDYEFLT